MEIQGSNVGSRFLKYIFALDISDIFFIIHVPYAKNSL